MFLKLAVPAVLVGSVACSSTPRPGSADFARDHEAHSFAIAANLSIIEEGQLAGGRAGREEVRVLGQHLIADHGRALAVHNEMSSTFQTDWGLKDPSGQDLKYMRGDIGRTRALPAPPPESEAVYTVNRAALDASPAATDVMRNHEEGLEALKAADGAAFDKMFLERQITLHRYLLGKIDEMLPYVRTHALRDQLEKDRTTLQTHLRMAESIVQ